MAPRSSIARPVRDSHSQKYQGHGSLPARETPVMATDPFPDAATAHNSASEPPYDRSESAATLFAPIRMFWNDVHHSIPRQRFLRCVLTNRVSKLPIRLLPAGRPQHFQWRDFHPRDMPHRLLDCRRRHHELKFRHDLRILLSGVSTLRSPRFRPA